MKTNIHDYFYFSKTQRNGFIIVMCLVFLTFFLSNTLSNYLAKPVTDFSAFKEEVMAFEAEIKRLDKNNFQKKSSKEVSKEMNTPITLFSFNPNIVTKEALIKLGIKSTVANTFIKYRNTGAKFYKKQDIKKVYGITDSDYSRLAPYIQFNQRPSIPKEKKQPKFIEQLVPKPLTPFAFNPNNATKQTLLALGLSEKVSQTIINFRSKGGQFWKKQDFKKMYGLTEKDYLTLAPYIEILPNEISIAEKKDIPQSFSATTAIKVDINNSNMEDWKKLKGIGDVTAKRIINFRDKLGGFISIEQIKMAYNVPDSAVSYTHLTLPTKA